MSCYQTDTKILLFTAKAYTLTYVSEDEDENPDPDLYGQDDFDHEMYRTDSFDRFCRRSPVEEDGTIDEIAQDADDDEEEGNSCKCTTFCTILYFNLIIWGYPKNS